MESRARSFGSAAEGYERFRPGPDPAVLSWLLPPDAAAVAELGAGTGALTRLLVARGLAVDAVEPDARMAAVLRRTVPGARVHAGVAEALPLPDLGYDAVLASSSWHWVDPARAVPEAARVLRPGGRLCALWTGIDRSDPFGDELAGLMRPGPRAEDARRVLAIGADQPFLAPEERLHRFTLLRTRAEVVGHAGTYSRLLVLPPAERDAQLAALDARLAAHPAFADGAPARVPFTVRLWRAERRGRGGVQDELSRDG